ncbi:MAG: hypothetical protein COV44_05615 [Deltaproteobacteria bacterium CG11_big_fil_rev_8_21_14_0_20_45_16]|nr:MAG: hypothetical protein COV44_05615 [Deltaproteobacteria bacterium CG11_big_fil_rev_8_21_14_0_20_45_16]
MNLSTPLRAESESLEFKLSRLAKAEVGVVARLASLREAAEKLPDAWTGQSNGNRSEILTKPKVIEKISGLEIETADRWNTLLNNLAFMKTSREQLDERVMLWRQDLEKLDGKQREVNGELDRLHGSLKDGILLNLARKIQLSDSTN